MRGRSEAERRQWRAHRGPRRFLVLKFAWATLALLACAWPCYAGDDPYVDRLRRLLPGDFAGFGQDALPHVIKGAPEGGGELSGGTDVVSLGHGGTIKFAFRNNVVFDGPGDDLVIFENPFHIGMAAGAVFEELAFVSVSADGKHWHMFPFDETSGEGLAGRNPVLANSGNAIDPLSVDAGGDRFDLSDLSEAVDYIRFVKIEDAGDAIPDVGDNVVPGDKGGFDLDAAAAINSTPPAEVTGVVLAQGVAVKRARVRLVPIEGKVMRRRSRANGRFRFYPVLPSGAYEVRAVRKGMGRDSAMVFVDMNDASAHADLSLE